MAPGFRGILVAGQEDDRGAVRAVGERNSGVGRGSQGGGDPGDDLEGNAGLGQSARLLASASEDERVAALQADDGLSLEREAHERPVDLVLGGAELPGLLAREEALASGPRELEGLRRDEVIVNDDVGVGEDAPGLERQQFRIPGPGAHEVYGAGGHMSEPDPACSAGRASPSASWVRISIESLTDCLSVRISRSGERGAS